MNSRLSLSFSLSLFTSTSARRGRPRTTSRGRRRACYYPMFITRACCCYSERWRGILRPRRRSRRHRKRNVTAAAGASSSFALPSHPGTPRLQLVCLTSLKRKLRVLTHMWSHNLTLNQNQIHRPYLKRGQVIQQLFQADQC